jgi:hypothetical protein
MDAPKECDVGPGLERDATGMMAAVRQQLQKAPSITQQNLPGNYFIHFTRISFMKIDMIVPKIRDGTL